MSVQHVTDQTATSSDRTFHLPHILCGSCQDKVHPTSVTLLRDDSVPVVVNFECVNPKCLRDGDLLISVRAR